VGPFLLSEIWASTSLGPNRQYRLLQESQQKSVATDSRQMICTTIWQRISPFVVAIPICPAYIAATLLIGNSAVGDARERARPELSIGL
jgi:hypothetical protein